MITNYTVELARRVDISTALGIADDMDYDLADVRPIADKIIVSPYFADWDFDLPSTDRVLTPIAS